MHEAMGILHAYCCLDILVDCCQTFRTFGCDRARGNKEVLVFDGVTLKT